MAVSVVSSLGSASSRDFNGFVDPFEAPLEDFLVDPLAQVGAEVLNDSAARESLPSVRRPAPRSRRFEHGSRPLSPAESRPRSTRPASRPSSSLWSSPARLSPSLAPHLRRRSLRLTRRGQLVLLLVVAAAGYGVFGLGRADAGAEHAPPSAHRVVVQQGDSLWSIADRVAPNQDPRDVVGKIESLNHLRGSQVEVGQQLRLP
jgi:hypothetical protein